MTHLHANALLVAIALIWGLAFIFQKTAMEHIGPLTFVAARSFIAILALLPAVFLEMRQHPAPRPARELLSWGTLGGLSFFAGAALQQIGLVTATVTNTGFLTGLYVVVTPLLVWAMFSQPPSRKVWAAVTLAFVGTWLLGGGTIGGFSTGDYLVAISALFWAAHIIVVERSSVCARPMTFTLIQFAVTGLSGLAGALAFEPISFATLWNAGGELLYVGVLSSAVTFALLAIAMRHTSAPEAAIIVSLETVFAALAAAILLAEELAWIGWLGAAMMFSATIIINLRFGTTNAPGPSDTGT